jgi:hypothetical protein
MPDNSIAMGGGRMATGSTRAHGAEARYVEFVDRAYWWLQPWGMPYFHLLDRIHMWVMPRTYLEIGVSTGASLTLSLPGAVNVGIDPDPKILLPLSATSQIFAETSDAFFAEHDVRKIIGRSELDLAFIDGLHHFEVALRDFMNIERVAGPGTAVLLHDCYPIDDASAGRTQTPGDWSGDVWRMVVCLKELRPDLNVKVVDAGPTGLGVITGLDPHSRVLEEAYDELVPRYMSLPYSYLDEGNKAELLNLVPNDWDMVRSLLPDRPFRDVRLAPLVTRRAMRSGLSLAERRLRRAVAHQRKRMGKA